MLSLDLLSFLARRHRGLVLLILGTGALSGLFSAGVVAMINRLLHSHEGQGALLAAGFAGFVSAKIAANFFSQLWLVRFAQDAVLDVTTTLCEKVSRASLRTIERAGADEIFTTLTDDAGSVVWAAQCFPSLAMNLAMVIGCGLYLLWLSPAASLAVAAVTAFGTAGYYWLHRQSITSIQAAREAKARLFHEFQGLTAGIKELLMNAEHARTFLGQELHEAMVTLRRCYLDASRQHLVGECWTQLSYYVLIGLMLVVFPSTLNLAEESLTGFVFAMLYLMNPVWAVIGAFPAVARGRVALAKIESLGLSMASTSERPVPIRIADRATSPVVVFQGVRFSYGAADGQRGFTLGPMDFTVEPGEVVFVVGGNGSGKSTFVKLLTGLYAPDQGTISLAGIAVTDLNRDWYRAHFAAVFSDYHLFERLPLEGQDAERLARTYLKLLDLEGTVTISEGRWSTTKLSQGQRRRLALVAASLEDRPIYVFDEWAADQDPHYKSVFYNDLLPDLRARGKALVVITHDDRYFGLGDRMVKLEDGMVAGVSRRTARPANVASL